MSVPPKASWAAAATLSIASGSETSASTAIASPPAAEIVSHRLAQPVGLEADGDDARAALGEQLRGGAADPGRGAGDDRGLVGDRHQSVGAYR